jgi:nucleotide-binding universal stress UspA family protein
MFRHLLVPLDGSHLAQAALGPAAALARRMGARVTLLHVLERAAPETVHGERHLTRPEDAGAYLQGVARGLEAQGVRVDTAVANEMEDIARTIASRAVGLGADLVVLCTHGAGGLRGLLFGRVAQQVLASGTVPVLLIHPDATERPPFACRRLLVPLDGTRPSEAALPVAVAIARAFDADAVLAQVVPTVATIPGERGASATLMPTAAAAVLDAEAERAAAYLDGLRARLVAEGVPTGTVVDRGEPVQALVAAVTAQAADAVVMATHARVGMAAVWTGSVAARFLSRITIPVLLVRAPAEEPAEG